MLPSQEDDLAPWLIYGATGYTGRLIAQEAVQRGLQPTLAGRNRQQVEAVATELDLPWCAFDLSNSTAIAAKIAGMSTVLHCAGPFSWTARPMIEACLAARANYLDITGEFDIIEFAADNDARAKQAGVTLMPAVGFDVVPSDCLAVRLVKAMPNASQLELAFVGDWTMSHGTTKTIFERVGQGGCIRRDGKLHRVPVAAKTAEIRFRNGTRRAVSFPFGDIVSAYHSTGIPNIEIFIALPERQLNSMLRWRRLLPLTRFRPIQWLGGRWIRRNVKGPTLYERETARAEIWGRVTDAQGNSQEATLETPEPYAFTAKAAVEVTRRVIAGETEPGFSTPAKAFGDGLLSRFEGIDYQLSKAP